MPCYGYSLSARECKVGSLLRKVKNSTCEKCYAFRGHYNYPVVQKRMLQRMQAISSPTWVADMSELISEVTKMTEKFFRWHDSGDIQDMEHLSRIVQIAENVSNVIFWLPTRERGIVKAYLATGKTFPKNLTVRISAAMIGQGADTLPGTVGSSVDNSAAFQCPSKEQGNICGDCRECWNPNRREVSYTKH